MLAYRSLYYEAACINACRAASRSRKARRCSQKRPVLATWDIRAGNWHIARNGTRFLAEACEMPIQSTPSHSARSLWPSASFHEGEVQFVLCVFTLMKQRIYLSCHALQERFSRWIKAALRQFW
jgi:hypothetical protein